MVDAVKIGTANTSSLQTDTDTNVDGDAFLKALLQDPEKVVQDLCTSLGITDDTSASTSDTAASTGATVADGSTATTLQGAVSKVPVTVLSQTTASGVPATTSGATGTDTTATTDATTTSADSAEDDYARVATVLGRHEGLIKGKMTREKIAELANKADTPDDEKEALNALLNDSELWNKFDSAKDGKTDGKISVKDIRATQDDTEVQDYAAEQAEAGTHNYVASDATDTSASKEMTANDAMRELFRYSESLPKNIDMDTLKSIADGTADMDKCPPQVAAAAQYFVDHPDEWKTFTKDDEDGKISRNRLTDLATWEIELRPEEEKAVQTLDDNKDIFFKGGNLTASKLEKIANDTSNSQDVRDAATLLMQPNSMLFGMLDNSRHGSAGNVWDKANDGSISKNDLKYFIKQGTNEVEDDASETSSADVDTTAQSDMLVGMQTDPDKKKERGGQLKKALEIIASIATIAIPGLGIAGAAAGVAARVGITAARVGTAAARVGTSATRVGTTASTTAARTGVQTATTAARTGAQGAQTVASTGTRTVAQEAAQVAQDTAVQAGKEGAKQGFNQVTSGNQNTQTTTV